MTDLFIPALVVNGTSLFAGTGGGLFRSTDNGTNWTPANNGLRNLDIEALAVEGTNLFAVNGSNISLSTDNGTSWTSVNTGLSNQIVDRLATSGTNLFAGTYRGAWRRPLSEMITSVEDQPTNLALRLELEQNFPNPFNPMTIIFFSLPSRSFAELKVFDTLGREVAVLLSGEFSPGTYSQQWEAAGLTSGIYFCRLQAGSFSKTKKLILLR